MFFRALKSLYQRTLNHIETDEKMPGWAAKMLLRGTALGVSSAVVMGGPAIYALIKEYSDGKDEIEKLTETVRKLIDENEHGREAVVSLKVELGKCRKGHDELSRTPFFHHLCGNTYVADKKVQDDRNSSDNTVRAE